MSELDVTKEVTHELEVTEDLIERLNAIFEGDTEPIRFQTDDGHIILFYSNMIDCRNCGDSVHLDDAHNDEFCDEECYQIKYREEAREAYEDAQYSAHKDRRRGI